MSNPTEFGTNNLPDLDKLEALARAATTGPWSRNDSHGKVYIEPLGDNEPVAAITKTNCAANADFIAAANPAAVLALIALARRAQPEGEAPQAMPCYGVYRQHPEENNGKEFFFCSMWHNETNWGEGHRVVKGRFVPDSVAQQAAAPQKDTP